MSPLLSYALMAVAVTAIAIILYRDRARQQRYLACRKRLAAATALIDTAVDAIITIDDQGRIEAFNPAAEKTFGYTLENVLGKNVRMLMPQPYRDEHDDYLRNYKSTGVKKIIGFGREVQCQRRDGSVFSADLAVSEVRGDGPARFTGAIRDLTARKAQERKLAAAVRRMDLALRAGRLLAWEHLPATNEFRISLPKDDGHDQVLEPLRVSAEDAFGRVHEEDAAALAELFQAGATPRDIVTIEYRIFNRNGDLRWVRNQVMFVSNEGEADSGRIGVSLDITESKRSEDRALSLGRVLEESRNELYVFERDSLNFTLVNRCARQNLGYASEDLLQQTPLDLKKEMTREELLAHLAPLSEGARTTVNFTTRHYRKDGSSYPVDVNVIGGALDEKPVYFAIIIDISDKEHYLTRLRRQEEEHRLTLEYAPLGILTMDAAGIIQSINRAGLRMTGYREADLVGRDSIEFVHADDRDETNNTFSDIITGRKDFAMRTHRIRTRNGNYVSMQTHNAAIHNANGRPDMIVAMMQDLTEQQAREKEVEEHRQKLAHVARLGTMGQMAAGLAHEINQPLAAIATYAQACQRLIAGGGGDSQDFERALDQVAKQAHRAGDVIRRMRALARGNQSVREYCDIGTLIDELMPLIQTDARHADLGIEIDVPEDVPRMYADSVQIQQILLNLLRNAIDAVHDASTGRKALTVRCRVPIDGQLRIEVIDGGDGVDATRIDQLFDPFFTTKKSGMGMGLSISKSIIEAHGGKIGYEPNPAGGAIFWFSLPTESFKETA